MRSKDKSGPGVGEQGVLCLVKDLENKRKHVGREAETKNLGLQMCSGQGLALALCYGNGPMVTGLQ